jgi:hypothetical protein
MFASRTGIMINAVRAVRKSSRSPAILGAMGDAGDTGIPTAVLAGDSSVRRRLPTNERGVPPSTRLDAPRQCLRIDGDEAKM